MRLLALFACCTLWAQPDSPKPIDRAKARELFDQARAMVSTAHPELQVAALRDLGDIFRDLDKAISIELFDQAFAAAYTLNDDKPGYLRSKAQGLVIQKLAALDIDKALEKLSALAPNAAEGTVKPEAYERVILQLMERNQLDKALGLLTAYGEGAYPYRALNAVLQKLPPGRPERVILFGYATTSFQTTPTGDFGDVILKNWQHLPRDTVQAATGAVVRHMLRPIPEGEERTSLRFGSRADAVQFDSRQQYAVYKLLKVVAATEPKRLEEILEKHPTLRKAYEKSPDGVNESVAATMTSSGKPADKAEGDALSARMNAQAEEQARVLKAAQKDPHEALRLADEMKDANAQVTAYAAVAEAALANEAAKDKPLALRATAASLGAMEKAPDYFTVVMTLMRLMGGIMEQMDDVQASAEVRTLIGKCFTLAERLRKIDQDESDPNTAPRDTWPSTQAARLAMLLAGRTLGAGAVPMLADWKDPDLRLVAHIALGRALSGQMPNEMSIFFSRKRL